MARLLALAVALLVFVPGSADGKGRATPTRGDFAGRVSIGAGRELYLTCRGTGRPTVLLEAGLRSRGDIWSTPGQVGDKRLETIDFAASFAQMRRAQAASPLRRVPLVVLSHGQPVDLPDGLPPEFAPAFDKAWGTVQGQLAHLEPGAEHVVATHSGHFIQLDQPGLVRAAIKREVDTVRAGRHTLASQTR